MRRRRQRLQRFRAEAVGQQLGQRKAPALSRPVEAEDLQFRGKLPHHLTADAAGDAKILSPAGNGDADKRPMSFADRFGQREAH